MKKIVLISVLSFYWTFVMIAQPSFSLNYLYLGSKGKYASDVGPVTDINISKGLVNNGIGIQTKFRLKNRLYIMPDAGYFFEDYEKIIETSRPPDSYQEHKVWYYAANVNLAYDILPKDRSSVFLFAGLGYLQEISWKNVHFEGRQGFYPVPPLHPIKDTRKMNHGSIICNIGVILELYLSENIFVNAGIKYMLDAFSPQYSAFPHINIGIGYSLKERKIKAEASSLK